MADKRRTENSVEKMPLNSFPEGIPLSAGNHLLWTIHLFAKTVGINHLKFRSKPGLSCPVREVESILHLSDNEKYLYEFLVNVGGLDGVSGPLPLWLNEILLQEDTEEAPLGEFLNIFSHRFIRLLYEAWIKQNPPLSYIPGGYDKISTVLFSLLGRRTETINEDQSQISLKNQRLLPYIGTLGHRPRSAEGLKGLLRNYFGNISIEVQEFIVRKVKVSENRQLQLNKKKYILGKDTIIGKHIKDISGAFRIIIGPLNYSVFIDFIPGKKKYIVLEKLVNMYVSHFLDWDMSLRVKGDSIPKLALKKDNQLSLGMNCWLVSKPRSNDEILFN